VVLDEGLSAGLAPLEELPSVTVKRDEFAALDPRQKRERTFEAIRDLFVKISRERPLIIAVEDLHWIDGTSEDFLDYLIERGKIVVQKSKKCLENTNSCNLPVVSRIIYR
jgi:predicted ATPase